MNKILIATLSTALLSIALSPAANAQSYEEKPMGSKTQMNKKMQEEMFSPKVSENMKKMHDQMAAIRMSKDSKEREMRLQDHMKTMHETIDMMGSMDMMEGKEGKKMSSMQKSACSDKMHTMMSQMMEQMMSHMAEQEKVSKETSGVSPTVGR